jgi:hypothetical protein
LRLKTSDLRLKTYCRLDTSGFRLGTWDLRLETRVEKTEGLRLISDFKVTSDLRLPTWDFDLGLETSELGLKILDFIFKT